MNDPSVPGPPRATAPDQLTADKQFEALREIVGSLRDLQAQAVGLYAPEVERIVASRCRDVEEIDHLLDHLLTFCGNDTALALFKRLCRYYWDIDPVAAAAHVYVYRDCFGEEEASDAAP